MERTFVRSQSMAVWRPALTQGLLFTFVIVGVAATGCASPRVPKGPPATPTLGGLIRIAATASLTPPTLLRSETPMAVQATSAASALGIQLASPVATDPRCAQISEGQNTD